MNTLIQDLRDNAATAPVESQDRLMGTTVYQRVYGLDASRCCELARAEIARLERRWSVFLPRSEVNELARRAREPSRQCLRALLQGPTC